MADKSEEKEPQGGQRFAASNHDQTFSKVEDLGRKPSVVIGYYGVVSANRFVAFDANWNGLGAYPTQDQAKQAMIDNYRGG